MGVDVVVGRKPMELAGRSLRPGVILALVCGVQFMVILDLAVVNVALPAIQADLGVAQSDLQWVVITYGLTFGGFLMLGGRAADLFGPRNVLVAGMALFTAASVGAGLAGSLVPLVVSRAVQGVGAALAAPAALAILASTFAQGAARNRALAVFGAVAGSAATAGLIVSGVLSDGSGWEWIFFVNLPIGLVLVGAALAYIPDRIAAARRPPDLLGAVAVTAGLLAIVYAISKSVDYGWTSPRTLGFAAVGAGLLGVFVRIEKTAAFPLVPLSMFRRRTLASANVVAILAFGSFYAAIFQGTLFMQQVLGYSAIRAGVAWIAATACAFVVALRFSARLVGRVGAGTALVIGQSIIAGALLYLSRAPVDAAYWIDLLPGFVALGVGMGFLRMATQVAAFLGVEPPVMGLAGGMIETAREIGGALGIAIAATVAVTGADDAAGRLGAEPGTVAKALTEGFQRGTLVAAGLSVASALAAGLLLRPAERAAAPSEPAPALARDAPEVAA
jgi:EmrB/QacA subfamily drug resistance transporter